MKYLCVFQGAGTAIGELPPYFMARAARLSGQIDEEEQELEELVEEKKTHPSDLVGILIILQYLVSFHVKVKYP